VSDKNWLRDKLAEGKQEVWRDASTQRFDWSTFRARLVEPTGERTDAGNVADDLAATRSELRADIVIDILSIRVRARDTKRRGRLVETWLRGSLIRRIIERPKPNRDGISHSRYPVLISFLCAQGIAKPDDRGGYVWHPDFKHLRDRAGWLVTLIRREGELRRVEPTRRYEIE
jgi:hypothetical protein